MHICTAFGTQRGLILADSMGSGKTVQALAVGVDGRVLFIVPAGVADMGKTTTRRFCAEVEFRAVKGGGDADSIASFMTGTHMLVVLYECCARHCGRSARMALLICDGAHMLGGYQTQRYTNETICPPMSSCC